MVFWGSDSYFQQDNAPCHTSRIVREYLAENDVLTLDWPPQNPDINIIENIWHIIKRKLHKNAEYIKNKQDLIDCFSQ